MRQPAKEKKGDNRPDAENAERGQPDPVDSLCRSTAARWYSLYF
jgi:hypothetical protein